MNTIQGISKTSFIPVSLSFGSPTHTRYFWNNLIIEKRFSINWLGKLYKGSVLDAFWKVLSSPVN